MMVVDGAGEMRICHMGYALWQVLVRAQHICIIAGSLLLMMMLRAQRCHPADIHQHSSISSHHPAQQLLAAGPTSAA